LKSKEGFLRALLTGNGHPGPVCKIAKVAKLERVYSFRVQSGKITVCNMIRLKASDQRRPPISSSKIFLKESL
jgi:hypothetical protein